MIYKVCGPQLEVFFFFDPWLHSQKSSPVIQVMWVNRQLPQLRGGSPGCGPRAPPEVVSDPGWESPSGCGRSAWSAQGIPPETSGCWISENPINYLYGYYMELDYQYSNIFQLPACTLLDIKTWISEKRTYYWWSNTDTNHHTNTTKIHSMIHNHTFFIHYMIHIVRIHYSN